MGRTILPTRFRGVPSIRSIQYANGQTFIQGAPLKYAAGQVVEASTGLTSTSANLVGFAMEPAGSKLGYQQANNPAIVTGRNQEVSVVIANRETEFTSDLVNGSIVPVAVSQTDIGTNYGIKGYVNAAGATEYHVDKSLTGANAVCTIIDVDTDQNVVVFKVLEAALQPA